MGIKLKNLNPIKGEYIRLWVIAAFIFVISPLISCLFASSDDESPIWTSISRLGWITGHQAFMYIWGAILMVPMCYAMWYAMQYADKKLNPVLRQIIKWAMIVFCTIIFVGACIPAHDPGPGPDFSAPRNAMALAHDHMSRIGMFGMLGVLMGYCVVAFISKQWEHAMIQTFATLFVICIGVWCFVEVKDKTSYCGVSAATQIIAFSLMNILNFMIYFNYQKQYINQLKEQEKETAVEEQAE